MVTISTAKTSGELLLVCRPHPSYSDGDILLARNRRQIRYCYAQQLSSVKDAGFTRDGLRPSGTLFEVGQRNVCRFRMERVSRTECLRIELDTLVQTIVGPTMSPDGYFIHVQQFIDSRMKHPRHSLFGTPGREYWYEIHRKGPYPDHAMLDAWWAEIEARTVDRESDYPRFPFAPLQRRKYLAVSVDDFDDVQCGDLTRPLLDKSIPDVELIVEPRKHWIDWRTLPDIGDPTAIINPTRDTDARDTRDYTRDTIVLEKKL